MKVLCMFTIETEDYGEEEFKREIEKLIDDIDPFSKLNEFEMFEVDKKFKLEKLEFGYRGD